MDRGSGGIPLPFHLQHNVHPQLFAQLPDMRPTKPQLSNLIMQHQQHQQPQPITAHTSDDEDARMGPGSGKGSRGKRKKVNHACLYCRRSHMTCDEGRPCQRCIKREIGHLCHDDYKPISTRPRDKSPTTADGSASGSATPAILPPTPAQAVDDVQQQNTTQPPTPAQQQFPVNAPLGYVMPAALPMQPQQPTLSQATTTPNWPLYPSQFAATAAATGLEGFGNEFADLTSILDNLDDPFFFNAPSFGQFPYPPSSLAPGVPMQGQQPQQPVAVEAAPTNDVQMDDVPISAPSSPGVSVLPTPSKAEKFFLAAADLPTGSRESRLNRVIHAKYEAGLLKPYNYATGYARLSRWMDRSLSAKARAQILQPLGVLRPKFREVALSLTDMDLVFTEEAFERLLLDYDRVFSMMGVPACLWRRTGEIYKANREFAELIGVEGHMLRDGRLCIYELMAEESAVNYWQKFGQVAFDPEHKAVLTSCVLRHAPTVNAQGHVISHQTHAPAGMLPPPSLPTTPHTAFAARRDVLGLSSGSVIGFQDTPRREDRHIHCCCSFTIRRDEKGIPSVIVGNFIKY